VVTIQFPDEASACFSKTPAMCDDLCHKLAQTSVWSKAPPAALEGLDMRELGVTVTSCELIGPGDGGAPSADASATDGGSSSPSSHVVHVRYRTLRMCLPA
jgi:hypothetical protein